MTTFLFAVLARSAFVNAHAGFSLNGTLRPRSESTSLKAAPCGNVARSADPVVLNAGETITVGWRETINHPGHFELQFSEDGDRTWATLVSIPDTMNGQNDLPHVFSTPLTLPAKACAQCTVRLVQSMEENPAAPSYYYSCADVILRAAPAPTPPVIPTPGPVACP